MMVVLSDLLCSSWMKFRTLSNGGTTFWRESSATRPVPKVSKVGRNHQNLEFQLLPVFQPKIAGGNRENFEFCWERFRVCTARAPAHTDTSRCSFRYDLRTHKRDRQISGRDSASTWTMDYGLVACSEPMVLLLLMPLWLSETVPFEIPHTRKISTLSVYWDVNISWSSWI